MLTEVVQFPADLLSTITDVAQLRWQDDGSCREVGSALFFPDDGASGQASADAAYAKRICAGCPVRAECREYALGSDMYGIWGGTSRPERAVIRRERGIEDIESEQPREDEA